MAAAAGKEKRAWKRWDVDEERMLAFAIKTHGTKQWEKVQQHMCTERTIKQLSDHWLEKQEQCKWLLEQLGPPPRPNKLSIASAYNSKAEGETAGKTKAGTKDKKVKGQATLLTRVPSLRYRFHPYQRDDRIRQAQEAADVDRVREALARYITHIQWLEEVFAPARPDVKRKDEAVEAGASRKGLGDLHVHCAGSDGKYVIYDDKTLDVQEGLLQDMLSIIETTEAMGVWEQETDVTSDISPPKGGGRPRGASSVGVCGASSSVGVQIGEGQDEDEVGGVMADPNFCLPGHVREVANADVRKAVEIAWANGTFTKNVHWTHL